MTKISKIIFSNDKNVICRMTKLSSDKKFRRTEMAKPKWRNLLPRSNESQGIYCYKSEMRLYTGFVAKRRWSSPFWKKRRFEIVFFIKPIILLDLNLNINVNNTFHIFISQERDKYIKWLIVIGFNNLNRI